MGSGGANMGVIIIGVYWDCLGLLIRIRSPPPSSPVSLGSVSK